MAGDGKGSLVGQRLGGYELLRLLGSGGMAEVYLAQDVALDREVAVKVMLDELKQEPEFERRFRSEAQRVANLRHPHVIPIYAAGVSDDGLLYMVMPVVPRSLRHRMEQRPLPSLEDSIRLAQQVAGALEAAHQIGLVHRDVKPENILLDEHDNALLTDFGIARELGPRHKDSRPSLVTLSATGLPIGTPEYMAPEQLRGEPLDQRADIFALGAVLYEMITGRLPHTGDTPYAVAAQTLTEPLVPPSQHNPEIWPELEAVVLCAMATKREERFPQAATFSVALAEALQAHGLENRATLPPEVAAGISAASSPTSSGITANARTYGAATRWDVTKASTWRQRIGRMSGRGGGQGQGRARRWWWVAVLALLLLGIGGVSLSGLLSHSGTKPPTARLTSTTSAWSTQTYTANATGTTGAIAAQATATSEAQATAAAAATATARAIPPTVPPPTATPTPALSLTPANLVVNQTTCQGSISIANGSSGTESWQWSSAKSSSPPPGWIFAVSRGGGVPTTTSQWPSDTTGIPSGHSDLVTLSVPLSGGKRTSCQFYSTYAMTMTDGNGYTYPFQITGG